MKFVYIVLTLAFLFGCSAPTAWKHIGMIQRENRNGQICDKIYNSSYELIYNSCNEKFKE